MPIPNRYKPQGTTAEVEFPTTRPCYPTMHSHINQVVADTLQWEQSAAFHLEALALRGLIKCYAKNDHLGLTIQYEYFGVPHNYEPDFVVRLKNGVTLLLGKRPGIPSSEGIGSGMKIASWFILGMWIQGVEYAGGGR